MKFLSKYQKERIQQNKYLYVEIVNAAIDEWRKLAKRYSITEEDKPLITKCQKIANEALVNCPELEEYYFMDYYDEAICEYVGRKYVMRRDKQAQIDCGFPPVIVDKKPLYLFPWKE